MKVKVISTSIEYHEDAINSWLNQFNIQPDNIISITQVSGEFSMTTTIFYKKFL